MKIQKFVIFVKKNLKMNMLKTGNILKLQIIVIIQVNIEVLCIAYVIQSIVCLKGFFKYDYHFIMKELAEEFEDNLLV